MQALLSTLALLMLVPLLGAPAQAEPLTVTQSVCPTGESCVLHVACEVDGSEDAVAGSCAAACAAEECGLPCSLASVCTMPPPFNCHGVPRPPLVICRCLGAVGEGGTVTWVWLCDRE